MMLAETKPILPKTTSRVATVYIEREDALVALECGHSYSVAAKRPPRVGDPSYCWRCAAQVANEPSLVSQFAFDLLKVMDQ